MAVKTASSVAASTPPVVWPARVGGGHAGDVRGEVHEGKDDGKDGIHCSQNLIHS